MIDFFSPKEKTCKKIKDECCSLCNIHYKTEKGWEYYRWRCPNCGYFFISRCFIDGKEILENAHIPQVIGPWKYFLYRIGWLPMIYTHNPFMEKNVEM